MGDDEEPRRWSSPRSYSEQGCWKWVPSLECGGSRGLVTPPSPRSLSAYSNRPGQRRKRSRSSRARGRSVSRGEVDSGVESKCITTSLGRPYTLSLPDDSSDADVDADSLRKYLTNSNPIRFAARRTRTAGYITLRPWSLVSIERQ
jgi:hypothetical protein